MEYYGCDYIEKSHLSVGGRLDLPLEHEDNRNMISLCCESNKHPGIALAKTPEETLERFLGLRYRLILRGGALNPIDFENFPCVKCPYWTKKDRAVAMQINRVSITMLPAPCQCRCFYCVQREGIATGFEKNPTVISNCEKIFALLNLAKREQIISPNAWWYLVAGEITIHPYKKQLMQLAKGATTFFFTNGFIFDEDIAKELHENPQAFIDISLDAGTPETWHKVKGVNNFAHVLNNLKRYAAVAQHPSQIAVKYIIFPGINDSDEDFFSFITFIKSCRMSLGTISRNTEIFANTDTSIETPASNKIFDSELIKSAARFTAMYFMIRDETATFSNYTEPEKKEILSLAQKILQSI